MSSKVRLAKRVRAVDGIKITEESAAEAAEWAGGFTTKGMRRIDPEKSPTVVTPESYWIDSKGRSFAGSKKTLLFIPLTDPEVWIDGAGNTHELPRRVEDYMPVAKDTWLIAHEEGSFVVMKDKYLHESYVVVPEATDE